MNLNNRLVIYFFYDADGIVDDYNLVMLKDIMKSCRDLFVVSNGELSADGRGKFAQLTDQILERENKGFDVGAYQEALQTVGWEKLYTYDEVILMNYTIMGPVYPFAEMFEAMDARELDFWGITKYHEVKVDPYGMIKCGYLREHIQSHFIAVRKPMLTSGDFRDYWETMPVIKSYAESVAFHESYFTHHFAKKGFQWDVYVNTDDMKKFTEYPLLKAPAKLIAEKRCPIFKRRSFNHDYIDFVNTTIGEPTYELMEYLKNHTDFDTDLIWDNILRCCNQALIKECLQLNYILPSDMSKDISDILQKRRVALVMHLFFEDLLDDSYRYACSMPEEADVFITVGSQRMKELTEEKFRSMKNKCTVLLTPNRGRDVGSVLVAVNPQILEYDYVCFAHDKKVTQLKPECKGASWAYQCFESVLKSRDYVKNVIRTFEENPRLGLLTPAPPNHAEYFPTMGNEWGANFENTKKLAKKLGIRVPMSQNLPPISALGCFFWYRPKAMKKLYDRNWTYEDFPEEPMKITDGSILHAIERLYSFAVQDAGYYPAWCFSDNVASMEVTNLYYMLREMNMAVMAGGLAGTFVNVVNELRRRGPAMYHLANLHNDLMSLYGARPAGAAGFDGMMHLYYNEGEGYSQKASEMCRASFRKNKFEVEFEIPESEKPILQLRFDPGEEGMILLKKLSGVVEYTDGSSQLIRMEQCDSNGFAFENKILFISQDPQVYIDCPKDKRVKNIVLTGKLKKDISPETVEEAISQRLPKLTPKLYFDAGAGIREEDSCRTSNQGTARRLEARFEFADGAGKIGRFRFDPCESGMFVLRDLEISLEYGDGARENVRVQDCTTNGYMVADGIYFMGEDPQIMWEEKRKLPVRAVTVRAAVDEEFDRKMMDAILAKHETVLSFAKKHLK